VLFVFVSELSVDLPSPPQANTQLASTVIKNALKGLFNTVIPHWFFII
jgi:hypothetical protein